MAAQPFELDRERAIRQILGQPEPGPFPVTLVWRDMGLILRRARVTVQNPYATIMDLRALIEEEFAIPPGDQRLFRSSGGPLSDGDVIRFGGAGSNKQTRALETLIAVCLEPVSYTHLTLPTKA